MAEFVLLLLKGIYPAREALWVAAGLALVAGALVWRLSRGGGPGRALLLACLWLALVEGGLAVHDRIRLRSAYVPDHSLCWILRPNLRGARLVHPELGLVTLVDTNSLGLRDAEPAARLPGELRVLCLGDSWTFGYGLQAHESWPKQLQEILTAQLPGRPVSVINAGLPGFGSFQAYHLLERLLPIYGPDIVVLGGVNWLAEADVPEMERALPGDGPAQTFRRWLLGRRFYLVLRVGARPLWGPPQALATSSAQASTPDPEGSEQRGTYSPEEVRYVEAFLHLARAAGARVLFFPHGLNLPGISPQEALLSRRAWIRADPAVALASISDVQSEQERAQLMQRADPSHPNAQGARLIAEGVAAILRERGFLPGELR